MIRSLLPRLLVAFCVVALPRAAVADVLTVHAAASLKTVLDALAPEFEAATGDTLRPVLAGSAALARQIAAGAPGDVAILANRDWMDALEDGGDLVPGTRQDLLTNRLVLVAMAPAAPLSPRDLPNALGDGRLAMALVDAVPAGIYGRQALQALGLWDALQPRVAQTDNVRAALALVASGAAPYGVVYTTDATAEPRVEVVATFPAGSHESILYPAAVLTQGNRHKAERFLQFLATPVAIAIFEDQGFGVLP